MLRITVSTEDSFDEKTSEFVSAQSFTLELEHSLASMSKWESNFEKPFLGKTDKTPEEILWYIQAMVLSPEVPPEVIYHLTQADVDKINSYIDAKMTATTFNDRAQQRPSREIITAEIIYYWMIQFNIPFECQYWHISRLLTLIKVCTLKQQKPKKMSRAQLAQRNRALNAERKSALGTRG